MKAWFGIGALTLGALCSLSACQTATGDAGCEVGSTISLPLTPFTKLANLRVEPVASGYVLIGNDTTTLHWATLGRDGTLGTEHTLPLPMGATSLAYALSRTSAPFDTVLVAFTSKAASATDSQLQFVNVPADGSVATAQPGAPVLTFYGLPKMTLASARDGGPAGLGWVDAGAINYARVDGTGQLVVGPTPLEKAAAFDCLRFTGGSGALTLSYQRKTDASMPASFVKAEILDDGSFVSLSLNVSQASATMGCAVGAPMIPASAGYAVAWQDVSGSWLSVYSAPPAGTSASNGRVVSYPFASATDFGGPDVQPPIVGMAAYGPDFGVMFQMPRSVEVWRLDTGGNRKPGALLFPSRRGDISNVSGTTTAAGALVATYLDQTSGSASSEGRRLVVDATCH